MVKLLEQLLNHLTSQNRRPLRTPIVLERRLQVIQT